MSSAIHDLQHAILGGQQSTTQLLRRAKLIASKLSLEELERWVDLELNGYPKADDAPKYREYCTHSLEYNNPYQGGWIFAGHLNFNLKAIQPIAEIERWSHGESVIVFPMPKNIPLTDFTGEASILSNFPQRFTVACTQYKAIIDGLTNELLQLTTQLEKRGIRGDNMNFNEKEKNTASNMVFNIGTVQGAVGNVSHSPVTFNSQTLYDYSSVQQLLTDCNIPKQDRRELEDIMDELKDASPKNRAGLLNRAEKWIVKHRELLGTGVELLCTAVGTTISNLK